uniref:Anticodon-binding domain-containing protein n=1 Tax=Timema douglasi TaxID=61478 RepID=A0A7R8VQS7_TIMDO|nr:unnamed protein product [Timema douglasi]
MSGGVHRILQLCKRHAFVMPVFKSEGSGAILDLFKFGPGGELLKHNVRHEWFLSNVVNTDHSVFPYWGGELSTGNITEDPFSGVSVILNLISRSSTHGAGSKRNIALLGTAPKCYSVVTKVYEDFSEHYRYMKDMSSGQLPFGLAEMRAEVGRCGVAEDTGDGRYFTPSHRMILRSCALVRPIDSSQAFYQWQKRRKMWWRKFSASPGRFSVTDVQSVEEGQRAEICAEFPWGSQNVECVTLRGSAPFDKLDNARRQIFEARDGRKRVTPHVIESWTTLECAVFTFLCDSHDEVQLSGVPKEVMRFHRKLAPYKLAFSASSSSSATSEELSQLAAYLTRQLRKAGVSTLLLPDVAKRSQESQFLRNDEMGVPYTAVLNDNTLKTGLLGLRSRETTLKVW